MIEIVSDASSRQHTCRPTSPPTPARCSRSSKTAPRVAFKRTTLFFNYTLGTLRNNTEGAFSIAPLGDQDSSGGRPTTTSATA